MLFAERNKVTDLHTLKECVVARQRSGTEGVAGIDSLGGFSRQFLVIPDVQRLAALRLTIDDLARALERSNTSIGAGTVDRNGAGMLVRSDARVSTAEELARSVVATRVGIPVLL